MTTPNKHGEADAVIRRFPAPIQTVESHEKQEGAIGPELGQEGNKERFNARVGSGKDMPALITKADKIVLHIPVQNRADQQQGNTRRQQHPGEKISL